MVCKLPHYLFVVIALHFILRVTIISNFSVILSVIYIGTELYLSVNFKAPLGEIAF